MMKLNAEKIASNIEARIGADIRCGKVGGASVLVMQEGQTVYQGCFGLAGEGRELTQEHIFRLASMTKPITGAAILKQVGRGLVSLDDPISKFIPGFEEMELGALDGDGKVIIKGKAQKQVTVLHLLTHTSGIGSGLPGGVTERLIDASQRIDLARIAPAYAKLPLEFEPYTAQSYSPTAAFDILARIVELTSGLSYEQFLKTEFFRPLGMTDTGFLPTESQWDRMVSIHDLKDGKAVFHPVDRSHIFGDHLLTHHCGGAGLFSTVRDYIRFAEMLLNEGKTAAGEPLLSPDLIRQMRTPAVPEAVMPWAERWGLSVRVIVSPDYKRLPVGAFGWSGAYGTHFWVDPENRITAVYMKNSHYDGGSGARTAWQFEEDVYL